MIVLEKNYLTAKGSKIVIKSVKLKKKLLAYSLFKIVNIKYNQA